MNEGGKPIGRVQISRGEHLGEIHKAVFRCRDITRKLLGFVRQTDIQLARHDVDRIIEGVAGGFLSRELAASNIEIKHIKSGVPLEVVTDRNQLEQVLLNIMNNAIDAIGECPGVITVASVRAGDEALVSIADNGQGMSREVLDKIFLPFFTTKDVGKGTGLGLSVSYGIVRSLGGRITVESTVGRGSTFCIHLPAA